MSRLVNEFMSEEFFFEKLKIYQRSLEFGIRLCKIANEFPIKFSRIRDQLIGAGISISLNIAEGSGRKSPKEKVNFYKISRTSLFECIPLLEICLSLGIIEKDIYQDLRQEATELSKMINGLIKSLQLINSSTHQLIYSKRRRSSVVRALVFHPHTKIRLCSSVAEQTFHKR